MAHTYNMTGTCSGVVLWIVSFLSWTAFTFLAHWCAKGFVQTPEYQSQRFALAFILTIAQTMFCYLLLTTMQNKKLPPTESSGGYGQCGINHGMWWAVFTHATATLGTNLSLTMVHAASTLTIKLMEPMTTALCLWAILGKKLSIATIVSLMLVIYGAVSFVGYPLHSLQLTLGVGLAILSNILYGFRSVIIKHLLDGAEIQARYFVDITQSLVVVEISYAAFWFMFFTPSGMPVESRIQHLINNPAFLALLSAFCHATYTYISMCVILRHMSVVSHATANIVKRVAVVLLMIFMGRQELTVSRATGLLVCTLGLAVYTTERLGIGWRKDVHAKNGE
jgi:drug/metabolite transporter (DMT)-like permease